MKDRVFEARVQPGGWTSVSPLPTPDELREFYSALYYQAPQSTTYQSTYSELDLRYKQLKCDALLHALSARGMLAAASFLDVGAGEGFLMDAADRRGLDVRGIDFSSFAVEKFFPRLKDQLVAGDIFDSLQHMARAGERFAAASAINVLEHVIDPVALLVALRDVLEPKGLLAITVPNDYSKLQALLKREGHLERDVWFAPPQHLHYFNAENVAPFCQSHGYELVDAFSDFPIDLFLLHPGSNYANNPANGPAAHRARMLHDVLMAEAGLDAYLNVYRALFAAGLGRDITVVLRPQGT